MNTDNPNRHTAKAEAMNSLHGYLNAKVPQLFAAIAEGIKEQKDGTLFKRDYERLQAILTDKPEKVRSYIKVHPSKNYATYIYLEAQTHYQRTALSVQYVETSVRLYPKAGSFEPYQMVTAEEIEAAEIEAERMYQQIEELKSNRRRLMQAYYMEGH